MAELLLTHSEELEAEDLQMPCGGLYSAVSLLRDPAAAHHDVSIVENSRLSRCDGALRLVEGDEDFVVPNSFNQGCRGLVAMANFHADAHRPEQVVDGDQVHAAGAKGARIEMLFPANDHLLVRAADLDDVERRARVTIVGTLSLGYCLRYCSTHMCPRFSIGKATRASPSCSTWIKSRSAVDTPTPRRPCTSSPLRKASSMWPKSCT